MTMTQHLIDSAIRTALARRLELDDGDDLGDYDCVTPADVDAAADYLDGELDSTVLASCCGDIDRGTEVISALRASAQDMDRPVAISDVVASFA